MDYPHIPQHIGNEARFEYFNLTQDERYSLPRWRKDQNILGYFVHLKAYAFLGYPPRKWDIHLSAIRDHTGSRSAAKRDVPNIGARPVRSSR
jgi:hypothetical protein